MILNFCSFTVSILLLLQKVRCEDDSCYVDGDKNSCQAPLSTVWGTKRYLLYDVNPGEGFNLRRDVYMRIATLVKKLNEESSSHNWVLVLPPWGPLYHWKSRHIGFQSQIKWSNFFDISSLMQYVPVIELEDFLEEHGSKINVLYYLQHYAEGWTDGVWEERADIRECTEPSSYVKYNDHFTGWFWGYENIFAQDFHCLSVQGYSSTLKAFLKPLDFSAIMIDRAEVILHDSFGSSEYWMVRRSMVFSKKLITIGNTFRKLYLNSTDKDDKTEKNSNNLNYSVERKAFGGPYIAVHLRRRDFLQGRPTEVPSIEHAAKQIMNHMEKLDLQKVFIATDAIESEFKELQYYIPGALRFVPSKEVHKDILDGGVAIVDQWICAHSRFFIGTFESTFSFRIQEEREILGFPVSTTFNRLCGDNQTSCEQPSKWTIENY